MLTDRPGFDRDLGIAGRVMVRQQDGTIASKLVHIDKPSKLEEFKSLHFTDHYSNRAQSSVFQLWLFIWTAQRPLPLTRKPSLFQSAAW